MAEQKNENAFKTEELHKDLIKQLIKPRRHYCIKDKRWYLILNCVFWKVEKFELSEQMTTSQFKIITDKKVINKRANN